MTVTERALTDAELIGLINGKHDHIRECRHAHREQCVTLTRAERDALIEELGARLRTRTAPR